MLFPNLKPELIIKCLVCMSCRSVTVTRFWRSWRPQYRKEFSPDVTDNSASVIVVLSISASRPRTHAYMFINTIPISCLKGRPCLNYIFTNSLKLLNTYVVFLTGSKLIKIRNHFSVSTHKLTPKKLFWSIFFVHSMNIRKTRNF